MLVIVAIKFIAPSNEAIPAKCKLNIAKSTDAPVCPGIELNGGYTVHPVPTPVSEKVDNINRKRELGNNQKLKLFNRGKAMSGLPINNGTIQLPKPPISTGITMKKIMTNACAVIIELYNWLLPERSTLPGLVSSVLIINDREVPIIPAKKPNTIYSVPISL